MNSCLLLGLFIAGALAASVEKRQLDTDKCQHYCPPQYNPVCASNGQTYGSMCEFAKDACYYYQKGLPALHVVTHSQCGASQVSHVDPRACDALCDEDRKPICASDGVVYGNICLYKRAECEASKNGSRLSILTYADTCPQPTTPDCSQYQLDGSDLAIEGGTDNFKFNCPYNHLTVCASDGHTYGNECQLCHQNEMTNASLVISYKGTCHHSVDDLLSGLLSHTDPLAG